jgi:hypothetical protein
MLFAVLMHRAMCYVEMVRTDFMNFLTQYCIRPGCILLTFSLLPLKAQNSMDNAPAVNPAPPPEYKEIAPAEMPKDETITPQNETGAPAEMLPAPPVIHPALETFAVLPSTIREGFAYPEVPVTVASLSIPAIKKVTYRVTSSDARMLACGPIVFEKGEQKVKGVLQVKWANVRADCKVSVRIFDPDHPETVMYSRLYLRKKPDVAVEE